MEETRTGAHLRSSDRETGLTHILGHRPAALGPSAGAVVLISHASRAVHSACMHVRLLRPPKGWGGGQARPNGAANYVACGHVLTCILIQHVLIVRMCTSSLALTLDACARLHTFTRATPADPRRPLHPTHLTTLTAYPKRTQLHANCTCMLLGKRSRLQCDSSLRAPSPIGESTRTHQPEHPHP